MKYIKFYRIPSKTITSDAVDGGFLGTGF